MAWMGRDEQGRCLFGNGRKNESEIKKKNLSTRKHEIAVGLWKGMAGYHAGTEIGIAVPLSPPNDPGLLVWTYSRCMILNAADQHAGGVCGYTAPLQE